MGTNPKSKRRNRIVFALVAVSIGGYVGTRTVAQRSHRFRVLAEYHARWAAKFEQSVTSKERAARGCEAYGGARMLQVAQAYRAEAEHCVRLAAFHAWLVPKYQAAAAHPWLPTTADPPEPKP
jgi:hypothetical protein